MPLELDKLEHFASHQYRGPIATIEGCINAQESEHGPTQWTIFMREKLEVLKKNMDELIQEHKDGTI